MSRYEDIIHLPHHVSAKHRPMPATGRAAQFAPFAALTGYEEAVQETARLTDRRIELDEDALAALNEALIQIEERIGEQPEAAFLCFEEDGKKEGGQYVTLTGRVRKIDSVQREIHLTDRRVIQLDSIAQIQLDKPERPVCDHD